MKEKRCTEIDVEEDFIDTCVFVSRINIWHTFDIDTLESMFRYKSKEYFVTEWRLEDREVERCIWSISWSLHEREKMHWDRCWRRFYKHLHFCIKSKYTIYIWYWYIGIDVHRMREWYLLFCIRSKYMIYICCWYIGVDVIKMGEEVVLNWIHVKDL